MYTDKKGSYESVYRSAVEVNNRNNINFKNIFFSGTILSILVWGSTFLLHEINNFSHPAPILKPSHATTDHEGKPLLNFSSVRAGEFAPKYKSLQWIREPESISNDKGTYVLKEEFNNKGEKSVEYLIRSIVDEDYQYTLYNQSSFVHDEYIYDIDDLVASPDLKKAILKTNSTHNWRHSTFALYWVLDVETHEISPVLNTEDKLSVAVWSPTSDNIVYILDNDVYLKSQNGDHTRVSFDGNSQIFNGKPDWVYEEEVFAGETALWWSPDGSKLTYLKANDTQVPEFPINYFVQDDHEDYPETLNIKYPKAGYPNPIVSLVVYDVTKQEEHSVVLESEEVAPAERLITSVLWVGNDQVLVKSSNRASTVLEIFLIDSKHNSVNLVRSEKNENGWFEISDAIFIPKNESLGREYDGYIDLVANKKGYEHLAYFSPPDSSTGRVLTDGDWEVTQILKFDLNNNRVYFHSTIHSSIERHISSVNILEGTKSSLPKIIDVTSDEGYFTGSFSSGSRYLSLTYNGPGVPYQELVDLYENKVIKTLESNDKLASNLDKYAVPQTSFKVVELVDEETGEKFKANSMETLPVNFDPKKKYPLLFYVYGGPVSQSVQKVFSVGFSSVVAAELDAVVVTVDGRGTGFNNHNSELGANYKFIVRNKLGHYEPLDQIAAAKEWGSRSYIDETRIAIWGWSYGGFLTLKTLETDWKDRVFSFGAAIAPVTKWKLYDSVYTERYMSTPQVNPEGYKTASIHNITNFKDVKRFFIGHGSGDDNVHFQNSLKLVDDFNVANVENYDFTVFPDSDHSIRYHNGNKVVYDRILDFFRKAFGGEY